MTDDPSTPLESENSQPQKDLNYTKAQIDELNEILKKGRAIISDIESYSNLFQDLKLKLDDPSNGLSANHAITDRLKNDIEAIKQSSQNNLQEITSALTAAQVKVDGMNSAYNSFVTIKAQIDDPTTGLAVTLSNAQKLQKEVETLRVRAEESFTVIQNTNNDIQVKAQEIAKAYIDFLATKVNIDDPKTGLEALLTVSSELSQKISVVQKQSNVLYEEIKVFRDEARAYTKEILDLKEQAKNSVDIISQIEQASEQFKASIIQSYGVIAATGLANSFDQRKRELEGGVGQWYNAIFWSTALLIIILGAIYVTAFLENALGGAIFWYRLTFASPVVFFIIFATDRYASERNLLEKYAFKSATAVALESYTTLLKNTFSGNGFEERILKFVLNSMETIYKEPFEHKSESKWSFGIKNKLGEIKAEIAGTKEVAEKIKEMLPQQTKTIVQQTTKNVTEEIEKAAI